jgi:hypothetical protein
MSDQQPGTTPTEETNPTPDGGQPEAPPAPDTTPDDGLQQTFDREYVVSLRGEAADWRKKYQGLKADQDKQAEQKLAEENRWKELADKREGEIDQLRQSITQREQQLQASHIRQEIIRVAAGKGVIDAADVLSLISLDGIEIDTETGKVDGVDKAVAALIEAKPYLVEGQKPPNPKVSPTNPAGGQTGDNPVLAMVKRNMYMGIDDNDSLFGDGGASVNTKE